MLKKKIKLPKSKFSQLTVIMVVFGIIGTIFLVASHAATPPQTWTWSGATACNYAGLGTGYSNKYYCWLPNGFPTDGDNLIFNSDISNAFGGGPGNACMDNFTHIGTLTFSGNTRSYNPILETPPCPGSSTTPMYLSGGITVSPNGGTGILFPITLTASQTWSGGGLGFGCQGNCPPSTIINLGSNNLTLTGGTYSFLDQFAGSGSLTISNTGSSVQQFKLDSPSFSGAVQINGRVAIDTARNLGTGPITIGNGAAGLNTSTTSGDGDITLTNSLTLNGGTGTGFAAQNASIYAARNLTLAGSVTLMADTKVATFATITITGPLHCNGHILSASYGALVGNSCVPDTTPPSVPTGLTASAPSTTSVSLNWTASTDNVGVTGYNVYRGGTKVATSGTHTYTDSGLTANTHYSYTVSAYDAANNTSAQSAAVSITTPAVPPPPTCPAGQVGTPPNCTTPPPSGGGGNSGGSGGSGAPPTVYNPATAPAGSTGTTAKAPITTASIILAPPTADPTKVVSHVDYSDGGTLLGSVTKPPFTMQLVSAKLPNGCSNLTIATHYTDGTSTSLTKPICVQHSSWLQRHYWLVALPAGLVLLIAGGGYVIIRRRNRNKLPPSPPVANSGPLFGPTPPEPPMNQVFVGTGSSSQPNAPAAVPGSVIAPMPAPPPPNHPIDPYPQEIKN